MKGKAKAAEFIGEGYNIQVTGRDVLVTEPMKNYVIEKISKLEKLSHRVIDVRVMMDIQKLDHRVDIVVKVDHVKIKSHAVSTDMYASIDRAVEKLEKQLRRYKKRIQDHMAKPLKAVDLKVNVFKRPEEEELIDINIDIEDANRRELLNKYRPHEIVKEKSLSMKILTTDEAVMKMELTGDSFLIYRNEEDMKLRCIYLRKDNTYGIIHIEA